MRKTDASRPSLPLISESKGQSLCQKCGLCCDGTLFSRVPLDPSEIDSMRVLGFDVQQAEHPPHFALPCVKLDGTSCSVYEGRPQNCRGYRCRVLQRLESGELSFEQAEASTRYAISLVVAIEHLLTLTGDRSRSIWARIEAFVNSEMRQLDQAESARWHSQLEGQALLLRRLLDDEFKPIKLPGDEI